MKEEFVVELFKDLKKVQAEVASDEELRTLRGDIRKYLKENTEDLEDLEDLETNQKVIWMR